MRFYPTKIRSNFVCFFLFSIVLILGCSKDSDLLLDSVITDDSVSSVEEKEKEASEETETSSEEETTTDETTTEETATEETQEPSLESRTSSFSPTNDAHFQSGKGYNQNIIRLDEGNRTSYLMFDLSPVGAINGEITDVTLQFTVDSDNGSGSIEVFRANSSNWSEENLSESNVPQVAAHIGTIIKEYEVGTTELVELNAAELFPEVSTLILNHKNGNDLAFASKEHPSKIGPKLVVTYEVAQGVDEITIPEPEEETIEENTNTNEQPIAVADATPSSGGAPLVVSFTGSNSSDDSGITSFSWDFKDGSTATTSNPTHTFTATGVFDAVLTVTDAEGLTSSDTVTITVNDTQNEGPKSIVSATPVVGEAPLEVAFKGSNSTDDQSISSYSWDFGNGAQTNSADFTYTYDEPGTYNAELTVTDENGLSDKATITITVNETTNAPPIARTSANTTQGSAPLTVQFTGDTSSDDTGIAAYSWDFKDGSTTATGNPSHTFTDPGTYVVELTVTDANGLSDKASITITVAESTNAAPVARTSANTTQGTAPLTVQFTGDASSDDTGITGYSWDFKDGSTAAVANPSHTFTDAGTYVVELTVNDQEGLTHKNTITITVNQPQQNQPPVAVVSANPTFGEAPLTVQFLGNSSTDDKAITSYSWNFKDGSTSTSANPLKTFNQAGSYSVDLTVTDADGATNTQSVTINVTNPVNNAPPGLYVATNGNSSNNGQSPSSPWSIEHAINMVNPGDVVYVKAGNYGGKQLLFSQNNGNSGSPIKFVGYRNTPGDITSSQGSTFNLGESVNASKMPLLSSANGQGVAITVYNRHIEFENFQITGYGTAISTIAQATNLVFRNIILTNIGNQNVNGYDGFGFSIEGNNTLIENCFVQNATAEAIKLFDSDNSRVNFCEVYGTNVTNPTDYYFLLTGGTNNTIVENSLADRAPGLSHGGHGFDMKDLAENNVFRNCTVKRTSFELNFSGVKNNIITDCYIYGVNTSSANWHAGLVIFNGANNNLIKNMYIQDTWAAISWAEYDDGYVGPGGDRDEVSMGYDNTFDNITINNTLNILNVGGGTEYGAWARRNTFKNCNFSNFTTVASTYYPTEDIRFENCSFSNGQYLVSEAQGRYAPYSNFDVSWINCSWANVNFTPPN